MLPLGNLSGWPSSILKELYETPGAGGGGGSAAPVAPPVAAPAGGAPAGDAGAGGEGVVADAGADDGAGAEGDDIDYDGGAEVVSQTLPEANLRTHSRRLQRQNQKLRAVADTLRHPDGRRMSPQEVNAVLANAREFENLDRILKSDKAAFDAILRANERLQRGESGPAEPEETPLEPFNDEGFQFETETPQGRALLEEFRANHTHRQQSQREIAALRRELQLLRGGVEQQTFSQIEQGWKSQTLTAAKTLPPGLQEDFVERVETEFKLLRATNQLTKANRQQVVERFLARFKKRAGSLSRPQLTRQSAAVVGNGKLPVVPRPGSMSPANGTNQPAKRETIVDSRRSLLARARG